MTTALDKLRFNTSSDRLNVTQSEWTASLNSAKVDSSVGIKHAALNGDETWRIHVAAIPQQVGCHFHRVGDETYEVVQGSGILHFGEVAEESDRYRVMWETPISVSAGDCFVVPEGYAHQLQRQGSEDLTILFACPDSHLDDEGDRTLLPDSPDLKTVS